MQQSVKKTKEQLENEKNLAMQEAEVRLNKQHEWQLREIREEQTHEIKQLHKRFDIETEDLQQRCHK